MGQCLFLRYAEQNLCRKNDIIHADLRTDIFMEWYVIILSEVAQRYIHGIISPNNWNYSQTVERFVLVMTDSVSSQRRRR
jgi:hypothetical protein